MVADDKVDAECLGIGNLVDGFDATVEHDDKLHASLCGMVDALAAHPVAFFIAAGDVVFDVRIELLQKLVDQSHRRTAVDVVVTIHHNALFAPHGVVQTVYGYVHVVHQKRVNQLTKHRTEEALCSALRLDATLDEQARQHRAHADFLSQFLSCLPSLGGRGCVIPFKLHLSE